MSYPKDNYLKVVLHPLYEGDAVASFWLSVTGEVEQVYPIPEDIERDDLGHQMSVHLIVEDFVFPWHCLRSRWKLTQALVQHNLLHFTAFKLSSSRSFKSDLSYELDKDTTLSMLKLCPFLVIRVSII